MPRENPFDHDQLDASNKSLNDVLAAEARGDASNLRGTDYHLLYALWLLITGSAESVHFYAGNDLLAKPAPPPDPTGPDAQSASLAATTAEDKDIWVQLKCTTDAWTPSAILADNLLFNFIVNSFISERTGRKWQVRLVTVADIRSKDVLDFVASPADYSALEGKLLQLSALVSKTLTDCWAGAPESAIVRERALAILKSIAECNSTPREVIRAQILTELGFRIGDRQLTYAALDQLIGGLLLDAGPSNPTARCYDRDWLASSIGTDLWTKLPLDSSVSEACDAQVESRLPARYSAQSYVERQAEYRLLNEFITSSSALCVLAGRSGTGKSILAAHWAHAMARRARLFLPADLLNGRPTLIQLIASELRPLTGSTQNEQALAQRLIRPSGTIGFGPLVIIIDDLRAYSRNDDFARYIQSLEDEARRNCIKLLFTCQLDVLANLKPFAHVRLELYQPETAPRTKDDLKDLQCSFTLDDFSDDELHEALRIKLNEADSERVLHKLRDPSLALLRNPYFLNAFLEEVGTDKLAELDNFSASDVTKLLDRRIDKLIAIASDTCRQTIGDTRRVLTVALERIWAHHDRLPFYLEVSKGAEQQFGSVGREILDALRSVFWRPASVMAFSDTKVGSRVLARHLCEVEPSILTRQLNIEMDHDMVVQLCTLVSNPVEFASQLVQTDAQWIAACSEGLARCKPDDLRINAALLAFARRARASHLSVAALARYSFGSRHGRKSLLRGFLSVDHDERALFERAFWDGSSFSPDTASKAIRLRFRTCGPPPNDQKRFDNWRHALGRSLQAIGSIDSKYAARQIMIALERIKSFANQRRPVSLNNASEDPLQRSYDQVRAVVCAYAYAEEFASFLTNLTLDNVDTRKRAVNALELVARSLPDRVKSAMCEAIRTEKEPVLLATLMWDAGRLAESDPDAVFESLKPNLATCWESYDSAAAAISLLEVLSHKFPQEVLALLPQEFNDWPEEARLLLREVESVCRFSCQSQDMRLPAVVRADTNSTTASTAGDPSNAFYLTRSKIIERILAMGRDIGLTGSPEIWRTRLRGQDLNLYTVDASGWIRGYEAAFANDPESPRLREEIIDAARSYHEHPAHVLDRWRTNLRFLLIIDSLDVLIELLARTPTPEITIAQLPDDWERLYAARQLFERGVSHSELIELALQQCEARRNTATAQASSERTDCLIALQKLVPERIPSTQSDSNGLHWFFTGGDSATERFAAQVDDQPTGAVTELETFISSPSDAVVLNRWNQLASTWQTILLSEPYSRMFQRRPILLGDAARLCKSILVVLDSIPAGEAVSEHRAIFAAILGRLNGTPISIPLVRSALTPIVLSNQLAVEILRIADLEVNETTIRKFVIDRRGWFESHHHRWDEDGRIGHGSGISYHLSVFFPVVRLALCAIGKRTASPDPGYWWMLERSAAMTLMKEVCFDLRLSSHDIKRLRSKVADALMHTPDQDVLHAANGHLLLAAGELDEAQASFETALRSPLCVGSQRGTVLYNLGCVFARTGEIELCAERLRESKHFSKLVADEVRKDPDLESVRNEAWFEELLKAE